MTIFHQNNPLNGSIESHSSKTQIKSKCPIKVDNLLLKLFYKSKNILLNHFKIEVSTFIGQYLKTSLLRILY